MFFDVFPIETCGFIFHCHVSLPNGISLDKCSIDPIEYQCYFHPWSSDRRDVSDDFGLGKVDWQGRCWNHHSRIHPLKFNIAPEKWMVGILVSFGEGPFSGAMLNFRRVVIHINLGANVIQKPFLGILGTLPNRAGCVWSRRNLPIKHMTLGTAKTPNHFSKNHPTFGNYRKNQTEQKKRTIGSTVHFLLVFSPCSFESQIQKA